MLVLARSVDEKILIGNDIVVTVVRVCGRKVYLGFEAPQEVSIHRFEVAYDIESGGTGGRVISQRQANLEVQKETP